MRNDENLRPMQRTELSMHFFSKLVFSLIQALPSDTRVSVLRSNGKKSSEQSVGGPPIHHSACSSLVGQKEEEWTKRVAAHFYSFQTNVSVG